MRGAAVAANADKRKEFSSACITKPEEYGNELPNLRTTVVFHGILG